MQPPQKDIEYWYYMLKRVPQICGNYAFTYKYTPTYLVLCISVFVMPVKEQRKSLKYHEMRIKGKEIYAEE